MNIYIGIDAGTTNTKAAAFDEEGRRLAMASRPTPADGEGRIFAEELYTQVCEALREVAAALPFGRVRGLAVSSVGESGVLLDEQDKPLAPALAWYDTCSAPQAARLEEALGREHLYALTGQPPSFKFGITKIMWWRDNHPDLFARAKKWATLNEYLMLRLSGEWAVDYSIAARTMAFDIRTLTWSEEILSAAGLGRDFFAPPVPGGTRVGGLTQEAARDTGLPQGIAVCTGGHDHACAAAGSGVLQPGGLLSSMGTAEVTLMAAPLPGNMSLLLQKGLSVSPHCGERLYRIFSSMQACGGSVEWFLAGPGKEMAKESHALGKDMYTHMHEEAAAAQGPCPLYVPFLRGTVEHPHAAGAFLGVRETHSLPHLARGLLEGLCAEFTYRTRDCLAAMDLVAQRVTVVGGPAKSAWLMQRKADLSGLIVSTPLEEQAALRGAALLAACALGDMGLEDLTPGPCRVYTPAGEEREAKLYANYGAARPLVEQLDLP